MAGHRFNHAVMLGAASYLRWGDDGTSHAERDERPGCLIDVRGEVNFLIVSFRGDYETPAMFSLRTSEAICEVAETCVIT